MWIKAKTQTNTDIILPSSLRKRSKLQTKERIFKSIISLKWQSCVFYYSPLLDVVTLFSKHRVHKKNIIDPSALPSTIPEIETRKYRFITKRLWMCINMFLLCMCVRRLRVLFCSDLKVNLAKIR